MTQEAMEKFVEYVHGRSLLGETIEDFGGIISLLIPHETDPEASVFHTHITGATDHIGLQEHCASFPEEERWRSALLLCAYLQIRTHEVTEANEMLDQYVTFVKGFLSSFGVNNPTIRELTELSLLASEETNETEIMHATLRVTIPKFNSPLLKIFDACADFFAQDIEPECEQSIFEIIIEFEPTTREGILVVNSSEETAPWEIYQTKVDIVSVDTDLIEGNSASTIIFSKLLNWSLRRFTKKLLED